MKIFILVILGLFSVTLLVHSQGKEAAVSKSKVILDKNKPSVYITFEKLGGNEPLVKSVNADKSEKVSLRLHNNTNRPIAVEANYDIRRVNKFVLILPDGAKVDALPNGAEVEICYEAEAMPQMTAEEFLKIEVPKQVPSHYSCKLQATGRGRGDHWISSGSSIIFSVPRSFLSKNLKIYTLFNYDWESENGQMNANEPYHQVYFYSYELPYELREK